MIDLLIPIKRIKYKIVVTPPSDEHNSKLSKMRLVSFISLVMSALGWNPNTWGLVKSGNYLICSIKSSLLSS